MKTGDCRQLHRLQPAFAMAEQLARLGDGDKVAKIKLYTHARQYIEWKVQQGGLVPHGPNLCALIPKPPSTCSRGTGPRVRHTEP